MWLETLASGSDGFKATRVGPSVHLTIEGGDGGFVFTALLSSLHGLAWKQWRRQLASTLIGDVGGLHHYGTTVGRKGVTGQSRTDDGGHHHDDRQRHQQAQAQSQPSPAQAMRKQQGHSGNGKSHQGSEGPFVC